METCSVFVEEGWQSWVGFLTLRDIPEEISFRQGTFLVKHWYMLGLAADAYSGLNVKLPRLSHSAIQGFALALFVIAA